MGQNLLTKEEIIQHEDLIKALHIQIARPWISDSKRAELETHVKHLQSELDRHKELLPKPKYDKYDAVDKWKSRK